MLQGHPGNMAVVLFAMGFYGCGCECRRRVLRCAALRSSCNPAQQLGSPPAAGRAP